MSDEITSSCLSLINCHISRLLRWNISAGQFFELMLPVSFALTALVSTWVLASARRHRFQPSAVTLWTLCTLFFPLITLPLYLIARSARRRREKEQAIKADKDSQSTVDEESAYVPLRRTLPLIYLTVMLSLGALYFHMDSSSVDAHLMRANQARLSDKREMVIAEYRAALKLEDNAHTHNLLGRELLAVKRWDEALAELQAAERMGEQDDELSYNIAQSLDKLNRPAEAKNEYERFLRGPLCSEALPDYRCALAHQRINAIAKDDSR